MIIQVYSVSKACCCDVFIFSSIIGVFYFGITSFLTTACYFQWLQAQEVVPLIAECVKGYTKQRKTWKNISLIMLSIGHTNAHSAAKALNNLAI